MSLTSVMFGGPSPEHDISILTGLQAVRALGQGTRALYWSKSGDWYEVSPELEAKDLAPGAPRGARGLKLVAGTGGGFVAGGGPLRGDRRLQTGVLVNCCHGGPGEDGTLQAALDLAGMAYTGPSAWGAALGMDKLAFGAVVAAAGLPALPRAALSEDGGEPGFPPPYIVKPRFGGSSIGIDVVEDLPTAKARLAANPHLARGAVVEPYRPDLKDVQVALRSWPAVGLSAVERPLRSSSGAEILTYGDKYVGGEGMVSAPRDLPFRLPPGVHARLEEAAARVGALAGLRGVGRLDFLWSGDELYVNELNTIPGSLSWYLWVEPEVPFPELLAGMVEEARLRPTVAWSTLGADGTALSSAGTIAAKLMA